MGGSPSSDTCACGNPGALVCGECRTAVCRLCVRTNANVEVCLACRAGAIEREEARATASATGSGLRRAAASSSSRLRALRPSFRKPVRISKQLVYVPAAIVVALAAMGAVVVPLLADMRGAHAERRAEDALRAIVVAEESCRLKRAVYARVDELVAMRLLDYREAPGYELRVELAKDGRTFWARAIPRNPGLRGMVIAGPAGKLAYEGD